MPAPDRGALPKLAEGALCGFDMTPMGNPSFADRHSANLKVLGLLCLFVLVGILVAGLWPFHAPPNDITWLATRNGVHFGKHGTIASQRAFMAFGANGDQSWTLEMWIEGDFRHSDETLLSVYSPQNPVLFRMYRYQRGLVLQGEGREKQNGDQRVTGYLDDVLRRRLSFITITSGAKGTTAYLNGVAVKARPDIRLSAKSFNGQLVVGNSTIENDSWTGSLRGLALYNRELPETEISRHYDSWTGGQRPNITESDGNLALYLFDERQGNVVHNYANPLTNLVIPRRYVLLHEKFLDSPWNELKGNWSGLRDILMNIGGFIPLGFFFCAYWSTTRQMKAAAIAAVILGFMVSLTIEVGQSFLPTRDSGVTDLITNTFGTYLGVALYRWRPGLVRWALNRVVITWLPLGGHKRGLTEC